MRKRYREFMDAQTQLGENTKRDQSIILENFPPIGKLNAAYFRTLMKEKKDSGKVRYSGFTIWKRYGLAKRVLNFHKIEHDLDTLKKNLPKLSRKEPVTVEDLYTADELRGMFAMCKNSRDRAILEMLYESGCRVGELLSLQIENISFDGGPNEYTIIIRGKTGTRKIPMGHSITALKTWLNVHPFSESGKGPVFVMTNGKTRQMTRSNVYAIVKFALKDAGITGKKKVVHMFRHTRITEFVRLGIRGQILHKLVGWTKRSNMEAVYVHLSTDDMENEVATKVYGKPVMMRKGQLVETKMCPSCNQDMLDMGAKFCPVCGFPLTENGVKIAEKKTKDLEARVRKLERTNGLEARVAGLEKLIRDVTNGKVPVDKRLRIEGYEEPSEEEQEKILRETLATTESTPEGRAGLEREDAEIKEWRKQKKAKPKRRKKEVT